MKVSDYDIVVIKLILVFLSFKEFISVSCKLGLQLDTASLQYLPTVETVLFQSSTQHQHLKARQKNAQQHCSCLQEALNNHYGRCKTRKSQIYLAKIYARTMHNIYPCQLKLCALNAVVLRSVFRSYLTQFMMNGTLQFKVYRRHIYRNLASEWI